MLSVAALFIPERGKDGLNPFRNPFRVRHFELPARIAGLQRAP